MEEIEKILKWFKEAVVSNDIISPDTWMRSAQKLNILLEDLDNQIDCYEMQMHEHQKKLIKDGESVAKSEILKTDALKADEQINYRMMKSMRKRIDEHIRLAKKRATLSDELLNRKL